MAGQADEAAFSVTEAAGVHWVVPGIWYREETTMKAEHARAILAQGKKDGTYEPPIPEDDQQAVSEAANLIELAQIAAAQHVQGPEVEILLKMAEAAEAESNGNQGQPPAPASAPESTAEPAPAPKPAPVPTQQPQAESSESQSAPTDLSQIEPWEGYEHERVSEIREGITASIREYTDEELTDLLANVWAYETAHKRRLTILNALEDVAKRLQKGTLRIESPYQGPTAAPYRSVPQQPESQPAPQPAPESAQEQEAPPEPASEPEPISSEPVQESVQEPEGEVSPPPEPESSAPDTRPLTNVTTGTGQDHIHQVPAPEPLPSDKEDDDTTGEYEQMMAEVEAALERERLHKPQHPDEDIPDLPWDWTKISAAELQRLHGIYSSAAYYKNYLLAREERAALHCKAAADELHNALLVRAGKYDEHGKEKRVAVLEAEIEDDENIKKWRRRQRKHEVFAANHRNERDSMSKLVEALSRQEAMREGEWQRAGGRRS